MAEYCPSCGEERKNNGDECEFCGAYVTNWAGEPILTVYSGTKQEEELPETGWQQFKNMILQPKHLTRLMALAGLIVMFLVIILCSLLEKIG